MSYHKVECIVISCDNCGDNYEDHVGFSIFVDNDSANPEDDDWHVTTDGKHYCPKCHEINDNDELIIKPKPLPHVNR